jgi:inner membrane transporter RhtA
MIMLSMISIQFGATLAKHLFPIVGVAGTAMVRSGLAALLLVSIRRPWRDGPVTRLALSELIMYGGSLGAMSLFFYLSLDRIPLGVGVALQFLGPLGLALCMSRKSSDLLWVGLAGVGIAFLLSGSTHLDGAGLDPKGVIFALLAAVAWASYIVFGQRAGKQLSDGRASALGMVISALIILPFGIHHGGTNLSNEDLWIFGPLVAVLSSALPYSLEMMALTRLPAKTFGVLMSFEPAFAAILGYFMLGENLYWQQWLAIGLIIIASIGSILFAQPTNINKDESPKLP